MRRFLWTLADSLPRFSRRCLYVNAPCSCKTGPALTLGRGKSYSICEQLC